MRESGPSFDSSPRTIPIFCPQISSRSFGRIALGFLDAQHLSEPVHWHADQLERCGSVKEMLAFYILVLFRILGFFANAPIFSQKRLPTLWKIASSILVVLILSPLLNPRPMILNPLWLALAVVWETGLGFIFGLVLSCSVGAAVSAGSLIDTQMGFANASILGPSGDQAEPISASFLKLCFLLLCLVSGAHLVLIRILLESFAWFPVGMPLHRFDDLATFGFALSSQFFASVLWLALPVSLALLMGEVCIAFLSRLMPQMNMLISAAPFRVILGFVVLSTALPLILQVMSDILSAQFSLLGFICVW